jgi:hypothetical protein
MPAEKLSKKQIEALARQIKHDQAQPLKPAEKRLKINTSFKNAVKQMGRTPPPKK